MPIFCGDKQKFADPQCIMKCIVKDCKNPGRLHQFPTERMRALEWVEALHVYNKRKKVFPVPKHWRICSNHFHEFDFVHIPNIEPKNCPLKRNAIPTVFENTHAVVNISDKDMIVYYSKEEEWPGGSTGVIVKNEHNDEYTETITDDPVRMCEEVIKVEDTNDDNDLELVEDPGDEEIYEIVTVDNQGNIIETRRQVGNAGLNAMTRQMAPLSQQQPMQQNVQVYNEQVQMQQQSQQQPNQGVQVMMTVNGNQNMMIPMNAIMNADGLGSQMQLNQMQNMQLVPMSQMGFPQGSVIMQNDQMHMVYPSGSILSNDQQQMMQIELSASQLAELNAEQVNNGSPLKVSEVTSPNSSHNLQYQLIPHGNQFILAEISPAQKVQPSVITSTNMPQAVTRPRVSPEEAMSKINKLLAKKQNAIKQLEAYLRQQEKNMKTRYNTLLVLQKQSYMIQDKTTASELNKLPAVEYSPKPIEIVKHVGGTVVISDSEDDT